MILTLESGFQVRLLQSGLIETLDRAFKLQLWNNLSRRGLRYQVVGVLGRSKTQFEFMGLAEALIELEKVASEHLRQEV